MAFENLHRWPLHHLWAIFSTLSPLQWSLFTFTRNFLYSNSLPLVLFFTEHHWEYPAPLDPSSLLPSGIFLHMDKISLSPLLPMLNSPSALSHSLYNRYSKHLTIFVAHCCTHFSKCFSCTGECRNGYSAPDVSYQGWIETKDNFAQPADYTSLAAVFYLCCKAVLLADGQFGAHQDPHVLYAKLLHSWWIPSLYWSLGLFLLNHQDFAFSLVDLHQVSTGPFLQPVKVLVYQPPCHYFFIIYILAESSLCPITQMI